MNFYRITYKIKWNLKTAYWFLFQRNNFYCPACSSKLKERYCKKCDIVFWRGSNITKLYQKDMWDTGI